MTATHTALNLQYRTPRRVLVVLNCASFCFWMVLMYLPYRTDPFLWAITASVFAFVVTAASLFAVAFPYGLNSSPWRRVRDLDERQRNVRSDALAYSYWACSVFVTLDYIWSELVLRLHLAHPPSWKLLLWGQFVATSLLPALFIAWNEPDELT